MSGLRFFLTSFILLAAFGIQAQTKKAQPKFTPYQGTVTAMDTKVAPDVLHEKFEISGLYPNPLQKTLYIKGSSIPGCNEGECLSIIISDIHGEPYYQDYLRLESGLEEILVVDWPSQYYVVRIFNEHSGFNYETKIFKEK